MKHKNRIRVFCYIKNEVKFLDKVFFRIQYECKYTDKQVSISSTLYARIFRANVFSAAFYVHTYVEKSCRIDDVLTNLRKIRT